MSQLTARPATKDDRSELEQFTCTTANGPRHERLVQRYFRVQAIAHAGGHDAARTDHRLLLLHREDELIAVPCHRRGADADVRHLVFAAVRLDLHGVELHGGVRASTAIWEAIVQDIRTRPEPAGTILARVDPANEAALKFCARVGLAPGEADAHGLIVCTGPVTWPESDSRH